MELDHQSSISMRDWLSKQTCEHQRRLNRNFFGLPAIESIHLNKSAQAPVLRKPISETLKVLACRQQGGATGCPWRAGERGRDVQPCATAPGLRNGGITGDVPVVGDWNGDGTSKVGVFRNGFFWVLDANGNHTF